jgi:hypothetical protein
MKNATLTNCRKSEKSLRFWQCPCRMQNRSTAVLQCANILKKRTLLALLHLFEHTTLYILQQLYQIFMWDDEKAHRDGCFKSFKIT